MLIAGRAPAAFLADGLRVGLSVCYDLRFPELYRALGKQDVRFLTVPSAFARETVHLPGTAPGHPPRHRLSSAPPGPIQRDPDDPL